MSSTAASVGSTKSRLVHASALAATRTPIFFWAALGAVFLCLATYVWGSWILSPSFRPAPLGSDPLPDNVRLYVRLFQIVPAAVALLMLWVFVCKPLLRTRELSTDSLLLINFLLLWWQDPIDNYLNVSFFYNGHAFNMGSWSSFIPGWRSPNPENFPEPLAIMGGFYLGFWMLTTVFGCWILRVIQKWRPNVSFVWRLFAVFASMAIIDTVVEICFQRTGVTAYPGVVRSLSLFPGKAYQWPLYEAVIIGFVCTGWVCLRYFRDDKGRTFVEKGVEQLQLTKPAQKAVTFLALAGFMQPFFLVGYFVPYNLFVVHSDTIPAYPSYLRTGLCGEGTAYACPSREWVPLAARDTRLEMVVGPNDPRLPREVRDAQGIMSGKDPYVSGR